MNLIEFFNAQERLDKKVVEVHGLEGKNLAADVTTALKVELAELAQEIGFFKYWKLNKRDDKARQFDEWSDCFHFILSLGNKYGHSDRFSEVAVYEGEQEKPYNELFSYLFECDYSEVLSYYKAIGAMIAVGQKIGMTEQDMETAYFTKNRVNYERLASGY